MDMLKEVLLQNLVSLFTTPDSMQKLRVAYVLNNNHRSRRNSCFSLWACSMSINEQTGQRRYDPKKSVLILRLIADLFIEHPEVVRTPTFPFLPSISRTLVTKPLSGPPSINMFAFPPIPATPAACATFACFVYSS